MFLTINSDGMIISSASYAQNEQEAAAQGNQVVQIDDAVYNQSMIGCLYDATKAPYFVLRPTPFHEVVQRQYVLTEEGLARFWKTVRDFRNKLIQSTDWTQLADVTLSDDKKLAYMQLREDLRNVTNTHTDPAEAFSYLQGRALYAQTI